MSHKLACLLLFNSGIAAQLSLLSGHVHSGHVHHAHVCVRMFTFTAYKPMA